MIDFKLLLALTNNEAKNVAATIARLAMADVAMTDAVIRIGVAYGVLEKGYQCGWSKD